MPNAGRFERKLWHGEKSPEAWQSHVEEFFRVPEFVADADKFGMSV
jgi:hypothetical protein